jgi:hypothetical protein
VYDPDICAPHGFVVPEKAVMFSLGEFNFDPELRVAKKYFQTQIPNLMAKISLLDQLQVFELYVWLAKHGIKLFTRALADLDKLPFIRVVKLLD